MKKHETKTYPGVHLLAGLLIFVTMTLTLGEISEDVINHEPLTVADVRLSNWLHLHGTASLTKAMFVITFFGSTKVVTFIALLGANHLKIARLSWA